MKEVGRSGEAVVKKKSSSGCLIIKKKTGGDGTGIGMGMGMGGFSGGSSGRNFFDSGKEKKRPRMVLSDSGSSDESLEPIRRKVVPGGADKFRSGGFPGNRVIGRVDRKMNNGLDVFEFDEYERFDEKARKEFYNDRLKLYRHSGGDPRESGVGSSRVIVDKRRHSYVDSTSNVLSVKSKSKYGVNNSRFEMEDDEAHLPISLLREKYREASDEPIRLQGKNGVLKVMVSKKKTMGLPHRSYDHVESEDRKDRRSEDVLKKKMVLPQKGYDHLDDDRNVSRSVDLTKKKALMRHSIHSDLKRSEKPIASIRTDKHELKLQKSLSTKSNKETDDSDTSLKLASPVMRACTSTKAVKKEGNRTPPNENVTLVKGKETKVKRGSGTEKQLLREKIRNMLLAAGWTIDYRPRRNRDYLDAVYINPSGTAYWSIIKAYEALQKQSEEEETKAKPAGNFTPLPDEILSKLTRQTRKKMEREMKKKRRDEGSGRIAKKARVKEPAGGTDSDQQEEKLSSYIKPNRKSLKGRMNESDQSSEDDSSDNLVKATPKVAKPSSGIHGRKSRKIGRTLVVRSSDKGLNSENDGFVPYTGKRTLLSWLIDSETVHMSEKVQYMNRRKSRAMLEGWITKDGIHCGCCSKILTVSKFELHAGSKLRMPFPNIFLQSGQSLMQCQIDAWNKQKESERQGFHTVNTDGDDPNDDTCGLCGDGGDLICCDGCPSTFHQSCLNIQMLPKGDWHCPNCACKFCQIARGSSTEVSGGAESALLTCRLCEKKYHESCSEEKDLPADSGDATVSFCGHKCRELYGRLQKLLGVKHEMESGFSWSLICRSDLSSDTLPLELSQKVECNSKLAIALSVMDECFLPIVDRRSGINLIHNVVYNCGSNFSRLNYSGFYTAILERGDEIMCAASIRIHGTQLAEMPFIGTRHICRRQGMCRRLLDAIESVLSSFEVEKLIIPAIAEHMHTWTDVFGFNPIEESHKQEIRSMNMLVFPGTDMLQKPLVRHKIPKRKAAVISDVECVELEDKKSSGKKLETGSSNLNENDKEIAGADSSPHPPAAPSDDSSLDTSCEPGLRPSSKENLPINSPSIIKVEEPCSDVKCPSPSDPIPAINETGKPTLDSPFKDDIQLPVMENRSKLDSSSGLDLNSCDTTEEQDRNVTNEKIAALSVDPLCKPEAQSPLIESISIDAQSENKVVESHTDMQPVSANGGSPVALATPDPTVNENIQFDNKLAEPATDMDSVSVGHVSPAALSAHKAAVKQSSQLDNKVTESTKDMERVSVSNGSPLEFSSHEDAVKENNQFDYKVPESATNMEHVSASNANPLAISSHEAAVKDDKLFDNRATESSTDVNCVSVSNGSPLALSSHEATVKESNQLEDTVTESSTDVERVSVSYASSASIEICDSPVKENIQSLTEEGIGDANGVSKEQAPCLKVDVDSLGEGNKAKDENGTTDLDFVSSVHENGEGLVKFSSDLNLLDPDETESKPGVASNAETKCKDVNLHGPSESESKDVNLPGQDETEAGMDMASNAETQCKDVTLPGPTKSESISDVASEVATGAGTEHKENTCTSQILL